MVTVAALVVRKGRGGTIDYMHAADAVLLAVADEVADATTERIDGTRLSGMVIALPSKAARSWGRPEYASGQGRRCWRQR